MLKIGKKLAQKELEKESRPQQLIQTHQRIRTRQSSKCSKYSCPSWSLVLTLLLFKRRFADFVLCFCS